MKRFYIVILVLLLIAVQLKAQAPNQLNYQGVARNTSGLVLPNQAIGLRFTIHQGSAGGTVVYQETQSATTNLLGLFTVAVGSGTPVTGTFAAIAWGTNTEYLQVEMDPTGGSSYLNMGTSQFLSVPYAISSGSSPSAWNLAGNSSTNGTNYIGTTDANDLVLKTAGNENVRIANSTGFVGVGSNNPKTNLVVNGAEAIGSAYDTVAPSNGLIVSGQIGIGTKRPNAGAALDITSSTQGLLIPRMATAPSSPSLGMQYFNTTSGCFMFYNGSSWQAIICGCPSTPATPGTITSSTGSGNFCPGGTGVSYSITPLGNATGYTWTVPTGATITAGQGSNAIVVAEGTVAGSVSVSATNNCGTGAPNSLAVTPIASNITGQPSNATITCSGGTATFTVTATGGGLTYQWQVNTGSGYTNVVNGGVYSNATTATLSIASPPTTMNGYLYQCIVTGTCSFTSNPATLTVSGVQSVPITITNNQTAATVANLAVMININFSTYSGNGENANLNNILFSTGPSGTGTPLYAWIESGSMPTSGTSTETAPSSSSLTPGIVWVNLGTNTIAGSGGTFKIYMSFMPSAVMVASATGASTGFTGEAPQWTGASLPTYGQFDNGALVFPGFYDNFAGTSLASKWTNANSATVAVSNNLKITYTSNSWFAIYTNTFASAPNNVAESYCQATSITNQGLCINTSGTNGNGINSGTNGVDAQFCGPSGVGFMFADGGSCTHAPGANATLANATPAINTFYVFSFFMLNPTPVLQLSYGAFNTLSGSVGANSIAPGSEVGLGASGATGTFQWFRIRPNAPGSVAPTVGIGALGCF